MPEQKPSVLGLVVSTVGIAAIFALTAMLMISSLVPNNTYDNQRIDSEIINQTVKIENRYSSVTIPLPGPGNYSISGGTVDRNDPPVEIGWEYAYWVYGSTTDKFGEVNTSHTVRDWGTAGVSNNDKDVYRIISIPTGAIDAAVLIHLADYDSTSSKARIAVSYALLPEVPVPPVIGSIVNCSRYDKLPEIDRGAPIEQMQPGVVYSSEGGSWFKVRGSPPYEKFRPYHYSYYVYDNYKEYTFPADLDIIDIRNDVCRVAA